jgi:hypothetical protein
MNYLAKSIEFGVENEACVVPFYQTSVFQKELLSNHIQQNPACNELLPIHWRVEVADQLNGWFPAYALHYRPTDNHFHIVVHDSKYRRRECYNGYVPYDYRVIRLIECHDNYSFALFNKFVRDSLLSVHWEVDWIETMKERNLEAEEDLHPHCSHVPPKKWIRSTAYYYIRATNVLVAEDYQSNPSTRPASRCVDLPMKERFPTTTKTAQSPQSLPKSCVLLYLDYFVVLNYCHNPLLPNSQAAKEFQRLIVEEYCFASAEAREQLKTMMMKTGEESSNPTGSSISSLPPKHAFSYRRRHPGSLLPPRSPSAAANSSGPLPPLPHHPRGGAGGSPRHHHHNECVICIERPVSNFAFIPCGHQAICEDCVQLVPSASTNSTATTATGSRRIFHCPICRAKIQSYLKVYRV